MLQHTTRTVLGLMLLASGVASADAPDFEKLRPELRAEVEKTVNRAFNAGVQAVLLLPAKGEWAKYGHKTIIANTSSTKVYGPYAPKGYAVYEPGVKAFPLLDEKFRQAGLALGWSEEVLYELWVDLPVVVSITR